MGDEQREQLLRGLSHELRAPLQSLLGHLDLLRSGTFGALTDDQAEALDVVARSAEQILSVTRDVLQVARIDGGAEVIDTSEWCLASHIDRQLESVRPLAADAGLALRAECTAPFPVRSDETKVGRILANLLTNAIKYAGRGTVVVAAARDGDRVAVEVRDEGPGIPPGREEAVFDEYVRLDPAAEGTGLGLPIARRLAGLLGGTLTAVPGGGGATLRLELPA